MSRAHFYDLATLKSQSSMDVQQVEHHLMIFSPELVSTTTEDSFRFLDTSNLLIVVYFYVITSDMLPRMQNFPDY